MQTLVKLREIKDEPQTDGSMRRYLEFEFSNPGEIARVNITKATAPLLNQIKLAMGKEVVMSVERREFNGRTFWQITDQNLYQFKTLPLVAAAAA